MSLRSNEEECLADLGSFTVYRMDCMTSGYDLIVGSCGELIEAGGQHQQAYLHERIPAVHVKVRPCTYNIWFWYLRRISSMRVDSALTQEHPLPFWLKALS